MKARPIITCLLMLGFLVSSNTCLGESFSDRIVTKVKDPKWLSRKALKYGFMATVCATNTLRMALEADKFDQRDIFGQDTYHVMQVAMIGGLITSGWMLYAVIDREDWDWRDKTELVSSTLFLCREFGEFTYQGMRHSDPFNNNPDWHKNELLGIATKPTFPWLRDDMISTGRVSTPALHIGFTALGANLFGRVK